jgi:large repetitive protein
MLVSGRVVGALVLVSSIALAGAPPAAASNASGINFTLSAVPTVTYSISGTVRADATSLGVAGVSVAAESIGGATGAGYGAVTASGAGGAYTIGHLLPGSYTLRFEPQREANLQSGYRGATGPAFFSPTTAATVTIAAASIAGIDVRLPPGRTISGKVTRANATTPIFDVDVRATGIGNPARVFDETWTDSAGNYTLEGLAPGSYQINFLNDPSLDSQTGCWYTGAASRFSAGCASHSAVTISSANVTSVNPHIGNSVRLTGRVMTRTTPPLPVVGAMVAPLVPLCNDCTFGSAGVTDVTGTYTITGLNPGAYALSVSDPGHYRDGFYSALAPYHWTTSRSMASAVAASGATTTAPIIKPSVGYFITGNVGNTSGTPIPAVQMTFVDSAGRPGNLAAATDAFGNYTLGPVAAGDYKIFANAAYLVLPTFQSGWYVSVPPGNFTAAAASAQVVHVAANVSGINVRLPVGATISGTVRLTGGGACVSCFVQALDTGGQQAAYAVTSTSGAYTLRGLSPGKYYVSANVGSTTEIDATHIRVVSNGFYAVGVAPNFSPTLAGATAVAVAP